MIPKDQGGGGYTRFPVFARFAKAFPQTLFLGRTGFPISRVFCEKRESEKRESLLDPQLSLDLLQ